MKTLLVLASLVFSINSFAVILMDNVPGRAIGDTYYACFREQVGDIARRTYGGSVERIPSIQSEYRYEQLGRYQSGSIVPWKFETTFRYKGVSRDGSRISGNYTIEFNILNRRLTIRRPDGGRVEMGGVPYIDYETQENLMNITDLSGTNFTADNVLVGGGTSPSEYFNRLGFRNCLNATLPLLATSGPEISSQRVVEGSRDTSDRSHLSEMLGLSQGLQITQ